MGVIEQTIRKGLIPITGDSDMFEHAHRIWRLMEGIDTDEISEENKPRLEQDPRLVDQERKILFCIVGDTQRWNDYYYEEGIVASGLDPYAEFITQVGSRHHGCEDYPDQIERDENGYFLGLNVVEYATWDRVAPPRPSIGAFWDHEPTCRDPDTGRWISSWPAGGKYSDIDVEYHNQVLDEMSVMGVPLSSYAVPRHPKRGPVDFFEIQKLITSIPMMENADWVQMNYYPHPAYNGRDTWNDEERALARESIKRSIVVFKNLFPGKQIVPFFFLRYGHIENKELLEILLEEIDKEPTITNIAIWSNPHSDFKWTGNHDTAIMARVFKDKLLESAPVLLDWVNGD